jgi:hypothetical protein
MKKSAVRKSVSKILTPIFEHATRVWLFQPLPQLSTPLDCQWLNGLAASFTRKDGEPQGFTSCQQAKVRVELRGTASSTPQESIFVY